MRPNPQENADLLTFTEEILNRKLHFLSSIKSGIPEINFNHHEFPTVYDQKSYSDHQITLHQVCIKSATTVMMIIILFLISVVLFVSVVRD